MNGERTREQEAAAARVALDRLASTARALRIYVLTADKYPAGDCQEITRLATHLEQELRGWLQ